MNTRDPDESDPAMNVEENATAEGDAGDIDQLAVPEATDE